jgi:carbon-monoxide dehydrogenase large subunit
VRHVGEALAVVVAQHPAQAEDAAERLAASVQLDALPSATDVEWALRPDAPVLFPELGDNVVFRQTAHFGDVESAFATAHRVFRRRLHTNRLAPSPLETRGALARFERAAGRLTVWSSTQLPHFLRWRLASLLGLPEHNVRVIAPDVGGSFGLKAPVSPEELLVAWLAVRLGRPVRWLEERREQLLAAPQAKEQLIQLAAAVDADGRLLGLRARVVGDAGAYSYNYASAVIEPHIAARLMPGPYRLESYAYEALAVLTNKPPTGAYRGVGMTAGHTAREMLLDDVARGLGLEPAEVRRRNLLRPSDLPYTSCTGMVYDSGSFSESLEAALEAIEYPAVREEQQALRTRGRYLGIGISPFVEPTAYGTEIARQTGIARVSHDNATVTIDPSGKVTVAVSVSSHGQGHETSLGQVVADALGVDLGDVVVLHGDTAIAPYGRGTGASRSAVVGTGSCTLAAQDVRAKLVRVAGALLEVAPDDLDVQRSRVYVRGAPDRVLTVAEVAAAAYFNAQARGADPLLSATRFYDPPPVYASGCFLAVVEVAPETGHVRVLGAVAAEDCGTVLNPLIVDGQTCGALVQAIGAALFEQIVFDADGQSLASTFLDYAQPRATSVPPITVRHLCSPGASIGGVKGMGESGMLAAPAAVINAVADALAPFGATFTQLPLTPERVWRLAASDFAD